jgi:EAL domain-containing protein (putative c-di-GMP-specific phosphodiesterase class I)
MDDAAIVRATIGLAHNLRLRVVAEGVETLDQLQFLKTLGCDEYQGYLKSRPLTAADFEKALRSEERDLRPLALAS